MQECRGLLPLHLECPTAGLQSTCASPSHPTPRLHAHAVDALTPATPLMDAGLDSLDMLKLAALVSGERGAWERACVHMVHAHEGARPFRVCSHA